MDELTNEIEVLKGSHVIPSTAFKPGHPRVGGRRPGSLNKRTKRALEICEEMKFHPAAVLITVIQTGKLMNADGTSVEIDAAGRMDALKTLCPYVMPRLQATQLSGDPDAPLVENYIDVTALLRDPATAEAAQTISLALAARELPSGEPEPVRSSLYNPQFADD